ncbi:class I SAM-dependent methyltransferase [Priestia abyssalis]|uniref:class I SAM-dependent methyltransferase n=1 Tax=Priestia abyssalis TaxID=1221450 RepID=UPI001F1653B6|nr:class I SAM-dependent methyltransferase [Priestia abyssalis]
MFKAFKKNFSKPEGIYGVITGKIMAWENKEINEWTLAHLNIQSGDHVLEVGFGPGYSIEHMMKNYLSLNVDGVDVSETMKTQAEKRLEKQSREGNVQLFLGDIEKVHLPSGTYDKVLSVNNYTIWNKPRKGLQNLYDAMKPGGKIAITMQPREDDASANKTRMFGKQIHDDLQACDFNNINLYFKDIHPELTVCVTAFKPRR